MTSNEDDEVAVDAALRSVPSTGDVSGMGDQFSHSDEHQPAATAAAVHGLPPSGADMGSSVVSPLDAHETPVERQQAERAARFREHESAQEAVKRGANEAFHEGSPASPAPMPEMGGLRYRGSTTVTSGAVLNASGIEHARRGMGMDTTTVAEETIIHSEEATVETPAPGIAAEFPPEKKPSEAAEKTTDDDEAPKAGEDGDGRQCRICFGGVEDEPELGRLISPCLCSGSVRYAHVTCINQWRGTGTNTKSFLECPQCKHQYRIRRTLAFGLATSKPILLLLTSVLFVALTLLAGHLLLKYLVMAVDLAEEEAAAAELAAAAVAIEDSSSGSGSTTTAAGMRRYGDVWENEDGSVVIAAPGLALMYDIVVEAVDIFLELAGQAYDRWPTEVGMAGRASRIALSLTIRFILGLSLLGSLSFLALLGSLSLFAPMQLVYTLRGTGIFTGPLQGLRRRAPNAGGILIILAVVIGVANSVVGVYDFVQACARRLLVYIETQILEVNPEDARRARETAQHEARWFNQWIAQRRWRRLTGWYELTVRVWQWIKETTTTAFAAAKAAAEARIQTGNAQEVGM